MLSENALLGLHIGCSIVIDTAFSIAIGATLTLLWQNLPARLLRHLRQLLTVCAAVLVILSPVQLILLAASMTGAATLAELTPQLGDVLYSTHAGRILMPQFLAAAWVCIAGLFRLPRTMYNSLAILGMLAYSVFKSASGHAASGGDYTVRELTQWLHLISIAAWSGGIMLAAWLMLPASQDDRQQLRNMSVLSRQSTLAVILVFASGLLNTWFGVAGDVKALLSSRWGYLLIAKVALVLAALALGAANRQTLHSTGAATSLPLICRRIRIEAWIMLAVFVLSGWLANVAPAV